MDYPIVTPIKVGILGFKPIDIKPTNVYHPNGSPMFWLEAGQPFDLLISMEYFPPQSTSKIRVHLLKTLEPSSGTGPGGGGVYDPIPGLPDWVEFDDPGNQDPFSGYVADIQSFGPPQGITQQAVTVTARLDGSLSGPSVTLMFHIPFFPNP